MKKKVMLGMSGGVDSSVAAALLIEQGYDVTGVTLRMWSDDSYEQTRESGGCCSIDDVSDARAVADSLGIAHYVLNFKDVFKEKVVDYFVSEYLNGRTPNPCVACNRYIKFEILMERAMAMGFDYVATGHYARIEKDEKRGRYLLKKASYAPKDQSYVLYSFTQEQLARTLMPLNEFAKEETRELAKKFGLRIANKPDSQDICFVEDGDYAGVIERYAGIKPKPGNFVDSEGNVLGQHKGIWNYTIGQRKGLGIAFGKPMFVTEIRAGENEVVLGEDLYKSELVANDINWIAIPEITEPIRVEAKIRYNATAQPAIVYKEGMDKIRVIFDEPQRAITAGQAIVMYWDDIVVGGGTIM